VNHINVQHKMMTADEFYMTAEGFFMTRCHIFNKY
jgi:hypothetical protein